MSPLSRRQGNDRKCRPSRLMICLPVLACFVGACDGVESSAAPDRLHRLGALRDLVLYRRSPEQGGAFFLDRFETTRRDWSSFLHSVGREATPGFGRSQREERSRDDDDALPIVHVTLSAAREYARWRLCRLPRADEWRYAASGGGMYRYPWGDLPTKAWINSFELGLDQPTSVGTFESGREPNGAYDLLGNVSEWTETVEGRWLARDRIEWPVASIMGHPALGRWLVPGVPVPGVWLVHAVWPMPRLVVGGHCRSWAFEDKPELAGLTLEWSRFPQEEGQYTGVRIASDPQGLLMALLALEEPLDSVGEELVKEFIRRPEHRFVLGSAWPGVRAGVVNPGPAYSLLGEVLGTP